MKRCTKCGIEKPEEAFEMQPSRGRRRSECKECRRVEQKEWLTKRKQNPPAPPATKKCNRCEEVKPSGEFSPGSPGYIHGRCKDCERAVGAEQRRKQYENDPTGRFYRPFVNEAGVKVKRCARCHNEKPVSEFYTNNPKKLHSKCKDCDKAIKKANYDADPEKYRKASRESMSKYPERRRAKCHRWHAANAERQLQYYRAYNATHTQERRAYWRSPQRRILANAWNKAHPEFWSEMQQRRRARLSKAPRIERIHRRAIIERDNWTCYLCGQICTPQNVTLDHVIPLVLNGAHAADNLRVACRSCNSRKGTMYLHDFLRTVFM